MIKYVFLAFAAALISACSSATPSANAGADDGEMCAGIAGIECIGENSYCKIPMGECVATADAAGQCTARPEICTMQYEPVCGCDGATYGNACSAASKGVSVAHEGACKD